MHEYARNHLAVKFLPLRKTSMHENVKIHLKILDNTSHLRLACMNMPRIISRFLLIHQVKFLPDLNDVYAKICQDPCHDSCQVYLAAFFKFDLYEHAKY